MLLDEFAYLGGFYYVPRVVQTINSTEQLGPNKELIYCGIRFRKLILHFFILFIWVSIDLYV